MYFIPFTQLLTLLLLRGSTSGHHNYLLNRLAPRLPQAPIALSTYNSGSDTKETSSESQVSTRSRLKEVGKKYLIICQRNCLESSRQYFYRYMAVLWPNERQNFNSIRGWKYVDIRSILRIF